jgi:hypothetical protein
MRSDEHHHGHEQLPPLAERRAAATAEQRVAADELYDAVKTSLVRFSREGAARAAGFRPGRRAAHKRRGIVHYRNRANRADDKTLDPQAPEGLVYFKTRRGRSVLLGAVFRVGRGETAPQPGGPIFQWHTHDPSCGSFYVEGDQCIGSPRMLHVWTTDAVRVKDPWIQPLRDALGRRTRAAARCTR